MWTDFRFWIFNIAQIFTFFSATGPLVYLYSRTAKDLKIDPMQAAVVISVTGIFNTVGRVIFGALGNVFPRGRFYILAASIASFGAATIVAIFTSSYIAIVAYAAVFGTAYGIWCNFGFTRSV